jgi:hypothetical protein
MYRLAIENGTRLDGGCGEWLLLFGSETTRLRCGGPVAGNGFGTTTHDGSRRGERRRSYPGMVAILGG